MPGLTHAYYSLNGQIQGERNISTGEYTHYSTDALGSVSTISGDKFDRCRYKPYGATLAGSPGTFGWVGSWGYGATGRSVSSHYVRARHYSTATRAWTTSPTSATRNVSFIFEHGSPVTGVNLMSPHVTLNARPSPPVIEVSPIIIKQIEEIARKHGIAAARNYAASLGYSAAEIAQILVIVLGLIAAIDLVRWGCTGETGPVTGIGKAIGKDTYDTGGEETTGYYLPSKLPKPGRTGYPRNCSEAGRLAHRMCDANGQLTPPIWRSRKWNDSEELYCLEVRIRMSRARDCYLARLLQERICGKKGPDGKIDDAHWDQLQRQGYENWIRGLKQFNKHNCWKYL